jgi:hypothetical protein
MLKNVHSEIHKYVFDMELQHTWSWLYGSWIYILSINTEVVSLNPAQYDVYLNQFYVTKFYQWLINVSGWWFSPRFSIFHHQWKLTNTIYSNCNIDENDFQCPG